MNKPTQKKQQSPQNKLALANKKIKALERQVEIEAALERVRARTMAMQHSDELREVVALFYGQLQPFGLATWGCEIIICDEKTGCMDYWFSDITQPVLPKCYSIPFNGHPILEKLWHAWQKGVPLSTIKIADNEKRSFDLYLFEQTDFNDLPEAVKSEILSENFVVFSHVSMKHGLLGAIDVKPISNDKATILHRFAHVFEQTYTRFLDLKKAEEQAREAQIETALERVRARSMGMHHSDELSEVVVVVFEQLQQIGLDVRECEIIIFDKTTLGMELWGSGFTETKLHDSFRIPYLDHPVYKKRIDAWQQGVPYRVVDLAGEEKQSFDRLYFEKTEFKKLPKATKMAIMAVDRFIISEAFTKHGLLETISDAHLPDDQAVILQRFAKVFEQTYTRFLDLKQAEEQAREAQIEAALERVRARTMAMHHADELEETAAVLFQQLDDLGIVPWRFGIAVIDDESKTADFWALTTASKDKKVGVLGKTSVEDHPFIRAFYRTWKNQEPYHIINLSGRKLQEYINFITRDYQSLKKTNLTGEVLPKRLVYCQVPFSQGALYGAFLNPLPEEQVNVLQRFTKVFEQTYTRYLDLRQAGEQAREAQIEAALERVRARSMAMHDSNELAEVITVVFDQLHNLGFEMDGCVIEISTDEPTDLHLWISTPNQTYAQCLRIPFFEHPILAGIAEARVKGYSFHKDNYSRQEKNSFFNHAFKHSDLRLIPDERKAFIKEGKGFARSVALIKHGSLTIQNYDGRSYSDDENTILQRFAKVFEQTYTRFLDLKQAEEQAREAQIETALERVRAKAMAMHSSEDLALTVDVFFTEVRNLYVTPRRCGVGLINEETHIVDLTVTTATEQGKTKKVIAKLKLTGHPVLETVYDNWKQQKEYHPVLHGSEIKEYYQVMNPQVAYPDFPDDVTQYGYYFFFKEGGVFAWTDKELSEENLQIYRRFTSVLSLTYRRYIDLKEAEEQAREAQIEAALERVRARTMGMHTSDELTNVAEGIFTQFQELEIQSLRRIVICVMDPEEDTMSFWSSATSDQPGVHGITTPMRENVKIREIAKRWLAREDRFPVFFKKQAVQNFVTHITKHGWQYPAGESPPDRMVMNCASYSHGVMITITYESLEGEDFDVLARFAKVFEQTYRRFLDLKQAEAQAREAQIEAALERIRAKSMAMHKSDELLEVVHLLFDQLEILGLEMDSSFINEFVDDSDDHYIWVAAGRPNAPGRQNYSERVHIPYFKHPYFSKFKNARKQKTSFITHNFSRKQKDEWFVHYFGKSSHKTVPQKRKDYIFSCKGMNTSTALTKDTAITICSYSKRPFNEEENNILKRIAYVFEQTYRRFLDLKQAEEQAREAQIEAALERVRARTMAMHTSDELTSVAEVVFEQFKGLEIPALRRIVITVMNPDEEKFSFWASSASDQPGVHGVTVPMLENDKIREFSERWLAKEDRFSVYFEGQALKDFVEHIVKYGWQYPMGEKPPEKMVMNCASYSHGLLNTVTYEPLDDDDFDVLTRFAKVFEQTYRRFLDLKKAEEQAREAQVEAALERVRAKAMGMHSSEDLASTVSIVFQELQILHITPMRCGVGLFDKETRIVELLTTSATKEDRALELVGSVKLEGHPVLDSIFEHWKLQKEYHPVLKGKSLKKYYELVTAHIDIPDWQSINIQYGYFFPFTEGCLYTWTEKEFVEEELRVFRKFTSVLGLTYRRYLDLKQAEARAREVEQQASLDRVRAEIASMRTADDLNLITPLIWRELTTLNVPFFRCGVFIIDEANERVYAYLSTPSGESLAALNLKFDSLPLVEQTVLNWRKRKVHKDEWNREQFKKWTKAIVEQGLIDSPRKYQAGDEAPERLVLQLVPFTQGMLYVGTESPLLNDDIELVQDLADAFSVAYARYEDFKQLEATKAELEAEDRRKAQELKEARQLQLSMLPKDIPKVPGLDIAVYMKTATEVGGDYYDFHVDKNKALTVAIGDATGHGLKAGTMVTAAKTLFSALAKNSDILSTFEEMNSSIKSMKLPLLSMCLAMVKFQNGTMKLSSAGIPPVLIYRNSNEQLEELSIDGMPLGAMIGFPYREKELTLEPGDTILMMSDGFPELMNDKDEMLDYDRAYAAFKKTAGKSSKDIIRYLVKAGLDWANGRPQDDDITFVVIKVRR